MAKQTDTLNAYSHYGFNNNTGPRPSAQQFEQAEKLGFRRGAKVTVANAMYLRSGGATTDEVCAVKNIDGKPQLNGMRNAVAQGLAKREHVPPRAGKTVYKITFSKAKGDTAKAKPASKASTKQGTNKAASKGKAGSKGKGSGKAAQPAPQVDTPQANTTGQHQPQQ